MALVRVLITNGPGSRYILPVTRRWTSLSLNLLIARSSITASTDGTSSIIAGCTPSGLRLIVVVWGSWLSLSPVGRGTAVERALATTKEAKMRRDAPSSFIVDDQLAAGLDGEQSVEGLPQSAEASLAPRQVVGQETLAVLHEVVEDDAHSRYNCLFALVVVVGDELIVAADVVVVGKRRNVAVVVVALAISMDDVRLVLIARRRLRQRLKFMNDRLLLGALKASV